MSAIWSTVRTVKHSFTDYEILTIDPITSNQTIPVRTRTHSTTSQPINQNKEASSERVDFVPNQLSHTLTLLIHFNKVHHPSLIHPIHNRILYTKNGAINTAKEAIVLQLGHRPGAAVLAAGETTGRLRGVLISPSTTVQALGGRP